MAVTRWLFPALLAAAVAFLVWRFWPTPTVVDPGRDAHIDSAGAVQAMADSALEHADTAIARARRDSLEQIRDSAAALGRRLDELDRLAARRQREKLVALRQRDSALAVVDSMAGNIPGDVLDTVTAAVALEVPDTALTCESRYGLRLEQVNMLAQALDKCIARRDTLLATIVGLRDTTARIRHYSAASDSLLRWERDRPRPCRVSLIVTSVGCGTAMAGTGVLGLLGGLLAH